MAAVAEVSKNSSAMAKYQDNPKARAHGHARTLASLARGGRELPVSCRNEPLGAVLR